MQIDLKFIEMEKEVWKDVVGYEGLYMISSMGRVKSLERKVWNGKGWYNQKECMMHPRINNQGYIMVGLRKDGKTYTNRVHRLVAMAFIPNPEGKPEVDHIDTNPLNNCVANLRWVTPWENNNNPLTRKHRSESMKGCEGTNKGRFGKEHNRSIPLVQLSLKGSYIRTWDCAKDVERELGFGRTHIGQVCKGKRNHCGGYRWMYLSDYNKEGTVA